MATKFSLTIDGMSCGHCVKAVESALSAVDGVESADVEIGRATVKVGPDVSSETLAAAIEEEGYTVTGHESEA
jgi:copper chaperone